MSVITSSQASDGDAAQASTPAGSPRLRARAAGLLYLATTLCGVFDLMARSKLVSPADPALTAAHISAAEPLYRAAVAAELFAGACYIGVTALLYSLLRPTGRIMAQAAVLFSLAGCAVGAATASLLLAPLVLSGGGPTLAALAPKTWQALSLAALQLHGEGYSIGMIFFGVYCLLTGVQVFRSSFLPRLVGVLFALAGAAWLTESFTDLLAPALSDALSTALDPIGFVGEASLCLWLIVFAVDAPRWAAADLRSQSGAALQS
jgi:hypothetical protein